MKKHIKYYISLVVFCCLIVGCGKKFEADKFVEANLDLMTRHDTKNYMKMTGKTKKETEKIYNDGIKEFDEVFKELKDDGASDEICDEYKKLFLDTLKKSKYKVQGSEEKGGIYTVNVKVTPMKLEKGIEESMAEVVESVTSEIVDETLKEGKEPEEEYITNMVLTRLLESLKKQNISYGKDKIIKVKISSNEKGNYEIEKDGLDEVFENLFEK